MQTKRGTAKLRRVGEGAQRLYLLLSLKRRVGSAAKPHAVVILQWYTDFEDTALKRLSNIFPRPRILSYLHVQDLKISELFEMCIHKEKE